MQWIESEFSGVDFGDERLVGRLKKMLLSFSARPQESIKASCQGLAEVLAAYRFCQNSKTSIQKIFEPHRGATLERIKLHKKILMVQDTTELDYTKKKSLSGKGPLNYKERQGFFAHNHLIVTPEKWVMGVWDTDIYARTEEDFGQATDKKNRKDKPIEDKESFRWLLGYRKACELSAQIPGTQVISCMDREGDIYDIFEEREKLKKEGISCAHWLVRNRFDRSIITDKENNEKLRNYVQQSPLLGTLEIEVTKKEQNKKIKGGSRIKTTRTKRKALLEIRTKEVLLKPPYRKEKTLRPLKVTVVVAREKNPPTGEEGISWVLLSSLPCQNFEEATEILSLYSARWEIEVFHRVLKTGCRIEELQLKNKKSIEVALALYMIVAWRVLHIQHLGRACPELPCDILFDVDEWQALWQIEHGKKALEQKPSLGEFINTLAKYGGYLGRKNDGPAGAQALWTGLTRLKDITQTWQKFKKVYNL